MGVERLNEGLLASDIICFSDFEGLGDFGMDAHKQLF